MGDQSRPPPVTGYPAPLQAAAGHPNANGYPTAGTAYPYPAPPPPQNHYPNPYYAQNPYFANDRRHICLRRVFALIVAATIITGAVIFIVWLVLRPRVPEFRVDSLTLTNFNISPSSLLSGNWNVKFAVRNPNKKISVSYDRIEASIYYQSLRLSETMIPPFRQGTRNETTAQASFAASSVYVDKRAVDGINSERNRGNLAFDVRIWARIGLSSGAWKARRRVLSVLCRELSVGISSNSATGSLIGGSKQCRVGL